jgi:charged multivesicular body protein 6
MLILNYSYPTDIHDDTWKTLQKNPLLRRNDGKCLQHLSISSHHLTRPVRTHLFHHSYRINQSKKKKTNRYTFSYASTDSAILDMKLQRDKLQRYQKKIQTILNHEHECAKSLLSHGDKARALLALRRKKYQEFLLTSTDKQLETLEQLTQTIEFALVEKDVLYGLRQGNAVLKLIHKEMMSLSDGGVQKLMDDTAEGIRYQREVSELLAGALSNSDEDEVEDELERLEREQRVITDEVNL